MKHRTYGGSTIHRTIGCPGWVLESEGIPRSSSLYANVGTALHDCMERMVLDSTIKPEHFLGQTIRGIEITQDLIDSKLTPARDALNSILDDHQVEELEPEVECSYEDDVGGYADMIMRAGDTVIVLDFKFGDGILVDPTESPQALFYGVAARTESSAKDLFEGATHFMAVIIQPTDRLESPTSIWTAPISVLDDFERQMVTSITLAKSKRPPIAAGDWCKFCPAAAVCPEKTGAALRALRMDPEDLTELANSLALVEQLKDWIRDVERTAFEQLERGALVDGWKMVAKRPTARWRDADDVVKRFSRRLGGKAKIFESKLRSPAQLIKLAKEKGLDEELEACIIRVSSGNTLAPETDKRPPVLAGEAIQAALKSLI
jgi:hypothetical protein